MKTRSLNFLLLLACFAWSGLSADNLIKNSDYSQWQEDKKPADWTIRSKQTITKAAGEGGLKVEVIKAERGFGEILQRIDVQKNTRYQLTGEIKASTGNLAFLQIKRYANGREMDRNSTSRNKTTDWESVEKIFNSDGAEYVEILLRWQQKEEFVGESATFNDISLKVLPPYSYKGEEVAPYAVPTFESVGLYWKPNGGAADRTVSVAYRKQGASEWREALPLWFDATEHIKQAAIHQGEYRGSIVYLEPGTKYEARLQLEDGPERIVPFATWSDDFKIARTVKAPANQDGTYIITEGGSAEEGYVLYEPAEKGAVWDVKGDFRSNMEVNASWVIVRGFTLKGGATHGIMLGDVNNVVIEDCDISGWGDQYDSGQAKNLCSAIYSQSEQLERIVIQNCELHHPRTDSNSWAEKRPGTNSKHPEGPQGITFKKGKGQFVIRFNRIYSDIDHMFNDGMGETANFGYGGFPNRDSDIHDNFVSHCWDDALEIEGADMNVRVWSNYMDMTYGAIGAASPSLGPLYLFRNVYAESRKHSGTSQNDLRGHYLVKLGNEREQFTRGKMYIFHNTALQPPPFEGSTEPASGAQSGIVFTSKSKLQENITSRNNVLQMRSERDWAIADRQRTYSNDFDYDMFDGRLETREGAQVNGVQASPIYERAPDGRLWLAPGTPGHDAGERIPNFNDYYTGDAPDMGAVETNSKLPKPKHWPKFPENYNPASASEPAPSEQG
ncbi:right-handed parallel beta-helix repeat-containing protein [Cerasicoccus fimbriatus]|uniref:right-handed parallel beta-helix repeat-containing protein n=1 Tax=Cerasicoccus fimbriatus TaxID=3014554 RepID=UPI0022B45BC4|nr:right-handed parallel beta-helix repeat-containing protein [Cerasicoccus sp. TK19100]